MQIDSQIYSWEFKFAYTEHIRVLKTHRMLCIALHWYSSAIWALMDKENKNTEDGFLKKD